MTGPIEDFCCNIFMAQSEAIRTEIENGVMFG